MRPFLSIEHVGRTAIVLLPVALSLLSCGRLAAQEFSSPAGYRAQLDELADWCRDNGLADEAVRTAAWLPPVDNERFYPVLPEALEPLLADDAPVDEVSPAREWQQRFAALRRERADELFAESRRAALDGHAATAYQSLWRTLRENPDHGAARRALGYLQVEGKWLTRFEADRLRAKQVWHPRFGWLARDHVARYEAGERYYAGRWMTAEGEAGLRGDMKRAWQVATEHYVVRTNHSLEAGVQLAARLERLQAAWRQVFAGYLFTNRQLVEAFARRSLPTADPRRHEVVYFRDRGEYLAELRSAAPQIDITTGIFLGDRETAYFFAADEEDVATQYHEATHQLFGESRPTARTIGRDGNFWIIEGVACYMESLREEDSRWVVGGLDVERTLAARERLEVDNFYVPLAELTAMGMDSLQRDPRIRSIYSQSTGLTQFLLHADAGRRREPLLQYLITVYTGRDRPDTLSALAAESYEMLDEEYRAYLTAPRDRASREQESQP